MSVDLGFRTHRSAFTTLPMPVGWCAVNGAVPRALFMSDVIIPSKEIRINQKMLLFKILSVSPDRIA